MKSHHYLSSSPQIAIIAEEAILIVDYKGSIIQKLDGSGLSLCNWSEGFLVAGNVLKFYKFEDQKYKFKNTYDNFGDKDIEIKSVCTNDDKILALLSNGTMMQGKVRY